MESWTAVRVELTSPTAQGAVKTELQVPWGILQREGPDSFFDCHLRFVPGAPVDLGRVEAVVKTALELYLATGIVSGQKQEQAALRYAADRYCLRRLKALLPPEADYAENMARLQCLNCRVYVPSEDRAKPCTFKPPRRFACCTGCGVAASRECGCLKQLARHVFDSEAPPEGAA